MSSLSTCIKKAGKALSRDDADAIREIYQNMVDSGVANPAQAAVDEYLGLMTEERAAMRSQIEAQGGRMPVQLKITRGNRELQIAQAVVANDILSGEETLNIPGARVVKSTGKIKATVETLARALVARTKAANRGKDLGAQTARSKEIVSEAMAIETEAAMERTGHSGNWYTTVLQNAVNIIGEMHPEIKEDMNAKSLFMFALAITSNGAGVDENAQAAEEVYREYKRTGRMPGIGYGKEAPTMKEHFELANQLMDRWGKDLFVQFLNTEFTVKELETLGFEVAGELATHKTHGSIIFGPKVGGGFYQNLMGNYAPITMDRWFMRTWGRLTGTLIPDDTGLPQQQADRFVTALQAEPDTVVEMGYTLDEVMGDDQKLLELAKKLHRRFAKGGYKEKTEIHRAAKGLDHIASATVIAPTSGGQRKWIREVVGTAIEKLNERGLPVNSATMQALLWYPEKDLYIQHGVGNAKSIPTDYEQAFERIARGAGVDQSRIDAARAADPDGRHAIGVGATEPVAGRVEEPVAPSLGRKERRRFIHKEVAWRVRQLVPRTTRRRVPKGAEKQLDGVPVVARYKPHIKVKNAYETAQLAAPEWVELQAGTEAAALFSSKITDAKTGEYSAAVYVYPADEYEGMRLFLTPDGMAGFALSGDDIVSAFKHPDSDMQGAVQSALGLAVSEGGRRLDAFDTALPMLYSMQGFRVVSRLAWDDTQAPADWNKETFKAFNGGEPDVVFMVYDQNRQEGYTGRYEGVMAEDYGAAVEAQEEAVRLLNERNKSTRSVLFALPRDTEERINRDPESPLARLHKLGATAEDQGNLGPASVAYNTIREFWDSGRIKFLLAAIPRRNIVDFLPKERAPSLQRYIRLGNRMDGRRNQLLGEYEDVASRWARWGRKDKRMAGRTADVMHGATLAGVDPAKPYRPLKRPENMSEADKKADALRREQYVLLKDAFDNLSEEAQATYAEVRDTYIKMRERVETALQARIDSSVADAKTKQALMDQLRQKFEASRVAGPYFPLMRFGDLWAVAKDDEGNVISYSRFENRADQKSWIKEFKDAGYNVDQGRRSAEAGEFVRQVDPRFATQVAELAKKAEDPGLVDEIWQLYLRSLPEMSMRKRFLHRKGRLGFHTDALRSYANVTFRGATQQAKLEYMHRMQESLDNLREEARVIEESDDKDFNWAMPVHDELVRRHMKAMNPETNPIAVNITGFGFLWYLGFTPAAAVVNLTQTPLVALPALAAKFNALGASRELLRAAKTVASGWRSDLIEAKLRGDEHRAFKEARRIGLFEKTQAHDLAGVTEVGAQQYGGPYHRIMEIGSLLFHSAEQFNREVTFLAGYRLGRQKGMTHDDALTLAEDLTWDSHFDYNSTNRPVWMQNNVMRVITLFKQYSLNMTYRIFRDANNAILNSDITPAERREAQKRFAGMMGMAALMAGYTGLPSIMTETVRYVAEAIFGDEDDKFDFEDAMRAYLADLYGAKMAEAIMKGPVDAVTGMTLSNRVSLGQLWFRDPGPFDEGEKLFMHYVMEILGPIPSTVRDVTTTGADLMEDGHIDRGLEKLTPKFVRDIMRAYRFSTEGAMTLHSPPDVLVEKEEFDVIDKFWQAFGFTPARLTQQYEQNNALRAAEKAVTDSRQKHIDAYMLAQFNQDRPAVKEAMERISGFNKRNPSIAITMDTLTRGAESRMQRSARSIGGVALRKDLVYLYKDLLFTDNERLRAPESAEDEDDGT